MKGSASADVTPLGRSLGTAAPGELCRPGQVRDSGECLHEPPA